MTKLFEDTNSLNRNFITLSLAFVILLPTLFYPISHDLACFILGGKALAEGMTLYSDFIDIKSPGTFYLFALLYKLLGRSEILYRAFDVLWQMATVAALTHFLRKAGYSRMIEVISAVVYCSLYASSVWYNVFQCESILNLPAVAACSAFFFSKNRNRGLLATGILIGIIAAMKYTQGSIIVVFAIFVITEKLGDFKSKILSLLALFTGFISGFVLPHVPLLFGEAAKGYAGVLAYMSRYSAYPHLAVVQICKGGLKFLLSALGSKATLPVQAVFYCGLFFAFFSKGGDTKKIIGKLFLSIFLVNTAVICYEHKFFGYHQLRNLFVISAFAGIGAESLAAFVKRKFSKIRIVQSLIVIVITLLMILPYAPCWYANARFAAFSAGLKSDYIPEYDTGIIGGKCPNPILDSVASYIESSTPDAPKLFSFSIETEPLLLKGNFRSASSFAHGQYFLTDFRDSSYCETAKKEIAESDWLIINTTDNLWLVFDYNISTPDAIRIRDTVSKIIDTGFVFDRDFSGIRIYRNKHFAEDFARTK